MTGRASLATGAILAPAGTTRRQLYVLAHECGHIALHSALKSRRKPRHVEEHEAKSYVRRAFAAHGLEVPEVSTYWARAYVVQCIEEDRARIIPICPLAEAFAMGRRSPYASLPSVDAFRRPKEPGPQRKTCATCRHLGGSQCDAHLEGHYQARRGPCDYGRSWHPLRRELLVRLIGAVVGTVSGRQRKPGR